MEEASELPTTLEDPTRRTPAVSLFQMTDQQYDFQEREEPWRGRYLCKLECPFEGSCLPPTRY